MWQIKTEFHSYVNNEMIETFYCVVYLFLWFIYDVSV